MIQQTQINEIREVLKEIYERGFEITNLLKVYKTTLQN